jgi:hypothetical protein
LFIQEIKSKINIYRNKRENKLIWYEKEMKEEKKEKKRKDYREHTKALFFTHMIQLKRYQ